MVDFLFFFYFVVLVIIDSAKKVRASVVDAETLEVLIRRFRRSETQSLLPLRRPLLEQSPRNSRRRRARVLLTYCNSELDVIEQYISENISYHSCVFSHAHARILHAEFLLRLPTGVS